MAKRTVLATERGAEEDTLKDFTGAFAIHLFVRARVEGEAIVEHIIDQANDYFRVHLGIEGEQVAASDALEQESIERLGNQMFGLAMRLQLLRGLDIDLDERHKLMVYAADIEAFFDHAPWNLLDWQKKDLRAEQFCGNLNHPA
jgi:hypothetical protein